MIHDVVSLVLRYNLRSLTVRSTDAVMTLFGVALCAAVIVVVSALERGISSSFRRAGDPSVVLLTRKGARTEVQSRIDLEAASLAKTLAGLDAPPSNEVVVLVTLPRRSDGKSSNVLVRGMDEPGLALRPAFKLVAGRLPSRNAPEVLASRRMAERIVGLGEGETFAFGKFRFTVVGIFEAGGTHDSEVWGPVAQIQAAFDRAGGYSSLRARLAGSADAQWTASLASLELELESNARIPLRAQRETDYYASQEESAAELPKVLGKVLAVLLGMGASVGATNSMYARVAGRTREIATLRALGYGRTAIVLAFLVESVALGAIGGALGAAAAMPIHGRTGAATAIATASEVAFSFEVTREGITAAVFVASLIGLLGGVFPAIGAARRPLPEALRDS